MTTPFDTIKSWLPYIKEDQSREGIRAAIEAIEADHFTAADMADAQAKSFRDGVASVTAGQEPVGYLHPQARQRLENGETVAFRKTPYAGEPTLAVYVGVAPVAQQPSKATLEKLRAWETNGELIDRAWQVLQSQEQEIMRLEKMLAEERTQQPQAEVKTVYRLSPTDIYDFAGWLTTRRGVMEVGSSKEAAPMAEAVGEYLRAYPERFAPQQAEAVPSSDLNPDEGDPVTLWAEIWRLREAVKGPDGYATWQDAATAERIRRVRAESKQAAPVAQQPQEIEVQCPVCSHKFYEWPNDKQPQAEAVPAVDRVYEAAKRLVDHADFQLGGVLSAKSKARDIPSNAASKVKARHLASLRDALAKTPHQAEAVPPPGYALVPIDVLEAASESLGSFVSDLGWTDADMQAMDNLDAILAQQKGQP